MAGRLRSRSFVSHTGAFTLKRYNNSCVYTGVSTGAVDVSYTSGTVTCSDHVSAHPYFDGPLDILYKRIWPPRIYGTIPQICKNGPFSGPVGGYAIPTIRLIANIPALPALSTSYYTTKMLASANPNVPRIDLPAELFELKDFPGMLRDLGHVLAGKLKPSSVPGGYLAFRFGWAPLFSDLNVLLNLADEVERTKKLLLDAERKGGVKIHRKLARVIFNPGKFGGADQFSLVTGGQTLWTGNWQLTGSEEWWYSLRLALTSPLHTETLDTLAFRTTLGLTGLSAATIWEELPWSWLVDYFVNVSDLLDINRGYLHYTTKNMNLMCRQSVSGVLATNFIYDGLIPSQGYLVSSRKFRTQVTSTVPTIALRPWFTQGMKNIVAALITARALRKTRL